MTPKRRKGVGRVLFELGSNRFIAKAKDHKSRIEDMARTNSENKYIMSVWSCVNGLFTGKPHLMKFGVGGKRLHQPTSDSGEDT